MRHAAKSKGLEYKVEFEEGDYSMKGDSNELKEAVKSFIDNSINYTPSGNINITLRQALPELTHFSSGGKQPKILLTVQDTGVGISDELKPKLFTKGGRDKDSLKVNVNSTGFGLSFVKGVVEAHHGRVWAESLGPDKGSTFYMELPVN